MNESKQTDGGNVDQESLSQKNRDQTSTKHFLQQLNDSLDRSVDEMDVSTQARLHAARREAVAASEARRYTTWLMPVGSLAAATTVAVLTVSLWLVPPDETVDEQMPPLEDFALLSDSEGLEFYEDLDFYLWLDTEKEAG